MCMYFILSGWPIRYILKWEMSRQNAFCLPFCIFMKLTTKSFMMIVFFFNLYFWIIQIISFEYFRLTGLIKNWILYHVWQLMCTENFYFHPDKIPIPKFWTFKKFPNIWQVLGGLFTHLPLHPHHWMTTKATILASHYQRGVSRAPPWALATLSSSSVNLGPLPHQTV